jgi:hypothetical protein
MLPWSRRPAGNRGPRIGQLEAFAAGSLDYARDDKQFYNMQMKNLRALLAFAVLLMFAACEAISPHYASAPTDRPGLGTKWGETRTSHVGTTSFERANFNHPFAIGAVYYNDEAGIRAMAGTLAWERRLPILRNPAAALVTIELRDQSGRMLPGLIVGDRWFVVGEEGRRYSIVVRNRTDLRLEVVLSVDGLDVIDGQPASFRKRGYIVEPHRKVLVEGFRQSTEAVAAFRFGPVHESYAAEKYHNTRNVGVVGIALFNEAGSNPWTDEEVRRRLKANPFPRRFATPP